MPARLRPGARENSARAPFDAAIGWIDAHIARLETDFSPLESASGRVLAKPISAIADIPPHHRAAIDGVAVRAEETFGASSYNPLIFALMPAGDTLPPSSAMRVNEGDRVPDGADAILALDYASFDGADHCEIIEPAMTGSFVDKAASHAASGTTLLHQGRRLLPGDIGLLGIAGIAHVPVVRRPRVHLLIVTTGSADQHGNEMMLRALIERDGGIFADLHRIDRFALGHKALADSGRDIVLVVGGTGHRRDEGSAAALAEAGALDIESVALFPGEFTGMGHIGADIPVFLLPDAPISCLFSYELIVGRAIRILAGRNKALPFRTRIMSTSRKITSRIGVTEACPVRLLDCERVEPIASFAAAGLVSAVRADGFVLVPEGSEGFSTGSPVTVELFSDEDTAA